MIFFIERWKSLCYNEVNIMTFDGRRPPKMKKKKIINRMISDILTFAMLFSMFVNTFVCATEVGGTGNKEVNQILADVAEVLLTVAGLVCVGKLIQIGIKYMTTAVEEKSNAKMAIIPWLIGTIVCFGAAWIGKAVITTLDPHKGDVLSY